MKFQKIILTVVLLISPALYAVKLSPGIHYLNRLRTDNPERAFNDIVKNNSNVLIDFYAEWCGPCKSLGAALPSIAQAFPSLVILKVDIDGPGCSKISNRFNIRSIPAVLCFKNGNMVQRINGFDSASALINTLSRIY